MSATLLCVNMQVQRDPKLILLMSLTLIKFNWKMQASFVLNYKYKLEASGTAHAQ